MRVYLPATMAAVTSALAAGEVGPAPLPAVAVTPSLRAAYPGSDDEELEYAAFTEAARRSLRLLGPGTARPRRVVLAADVAVAAVAPSADQSPGAVVVAAPVPLARVVSAHVDDEVAEDPVGAAVRAGLDEVEGHELLWYAVQELPALVGD